MIAPDPVIIDMSAHGLMMFIVLLLARKQTVVWKCKMPNEIRWIIM
jgi:hypothetical protein